jgi:hypothetical protein
MTRDKNPGGCLQLAAVLAALVASPSAAQSDGNAPLLLELPASTRALGLGGAFVLSTAESDAIFHNPGAILNADGAGLGVQSYGAASMLGTFSAATAWSGGSLAFGVQALSFGAAVPWLDAIPNDANDLLFDAPVGASELVGSIGYGREILGFRVGVVGKAIEQRVGPGRDATGAADVGIVRRLMGITFGVNAQNLGPGLSIGGIALPLPTRITLGASTPSRPVGPLDLLISTSVSRRRDGQIIPSGGLEIAWWPIVGRTFIGRFGVRRVPGDGASPFTFGLGFRGDVITIEYAFEEFDAPGSSHRLGLRWR